MVAIIDRQQLKTKIDRHEPFKLVETLPESAFVKVHLPHALHLPPDRLSDLAAQVLPNKNDEIIVYCENPSCSASSKAARELTDLGYTNVKKYPGGKQDWVNAGLPTESEWDEPTPPP